MHLKTNAFDDTTGPLTSGSPALQLAIDGTPAVRTALSRLTAYREQTRALPDPTGATLTEAEDEATAQIVATLDAGEPLTVDPFATVGDAHLRAQARMAVLDYAAKVEGDLLHRLQQAARAHVDDLYAHLNAQLEECIGRARQLGPQESTAEAAIGAGTIEQWQEREALAEDFDSIRRARMVILRKFEKGADTATPADHIAGLMSNPLDVWPDLPHYLRRKYRRDDDGTRIELTPPWPNPSQGESGPLFAWFIATPTAKAWVPTPHERATVSAQIAQAVAGLGNGRETMHYTERGPRVRRAEIGA